MSDEMIETVVDQTTETEPAEAVEAEMQEEQIGEPTSVEPVAEVSEETLEEAPAGMEIQDSPVDEDATMEAPADSNGLSQLKRKSKLQGKVSRLELYGAFIDVGLDTEALIHISQLGTEHVNRVTDVLHIGDEVTVWVEKVDPQRNQLMVTMIEPLAVEWNDLKVGNTYTGSVVRLENYGAFINIAAEREGLVHISEMSHDYVKHPSDVVKVGDEVQVQVLGFSKKKRRIDLSMKALMEKPEEAMPVMAPAKVEPEPYFDDDDDEGEEMPTAMEIALRRAMGDDYKADSRNKQKGKRRREKRRSRQDDILSRTLQRSEE